MRLAMKAIVQDRYGPPHVLQCKDTDKPVASDGGVLVRVHAAAVNIGDWHLLRGVPYVMRTVVGLRKPKRQFKVLALSPFVRQTMRVFHAYRGFAKRRPCYAGSAP
jgi:hypothetical protein